MLRYGEIPKFSREQVEAALARDEPGELLYVVLSAALHGEDPAWAEDLCVRLSSHPHFNVRGNAILGFGHIARIHGGLNREVVQPLLEAALRDPHEFVRAQADAAVDDVEHFLGWRLSRHDPAQG